VVKQAKVNATSSTATLNRSTWTLFIANLLCGKTVAVRPPARAEQLNRTATSNGRFPSAKDNRGGGQKTIAVQWHFSAFPHYTAIKRPEA
jgi:hypothetical protein